MSAVCLALYQTAELRAAREAAIRIALRDWTAPMELTDAQRDTCVRQALTQFRNGMSTASAIATGKAEASKFDQQNRSQRT